MMDLEIRAVTSEAETTTNNNNDAMQRGCNGPRRTPCDMVVGPTGPMGRTPGCFLSKAKIKAWLTGLSGRWNEFETQAPTTQEL